MSLTLPRSSGLIDLHCHILPDLDDGAASLEESLEMAKGAAADGIRTIVATPHLFRGPYSSDDLGAVGRKCEELNRTLEEHTVPIKVLTGAEVHISHNLIDEIRANKEKLVLNGGSYLFVEFPPEHIFSGVKSLFFELMSEGLTPIVAHPERNSVFCRKPEILYELIQMGSLSQANAGSFEGRYGRQAAEAVRLFLNLNLIHIIASDGHNAQASMPRLSDALKLAREMVGRERALALVRDNPLAVVEDRALPSVLPPVSPAKKEKSLKIKIPGFFSSRK